MSLVMIIEDEEPLAMLLSYNLEKEGYEVATVSNGLNAISEIERLMPSVILLDWMLPEISGVERCKLEHTDYYAYGKKPGRRQN